MIRDSKVQACDRDRYPDLKHLTTLNRVDQDKIRQTARTDFDSPSNLHRIEQVFRISDVFGNQLIDAILITVFGRQTHISSVVPLLQLTNGARPVA